MVLSGMILSFSVVLLSFSATTVTGRGEKFRVDKDHLEEELNHMMPEEKFDLDDNEQRQFHYFKIHDHNNDNRMDGIELGAAITHYHKEGGTHDSNKGVNMSDEELGTLIDTTLEMYDLNIDGYVDFYEFVEAQKQLATPQ